MEKQLMINVDRCNGCRMCEMACSLTKEGECSTQCSRIKLVKTGEGIDVPIVCLQCKDPACKSVCPVEAITRDFSGTIIIDQDLCIGCMKCMKACPVGAVSVDLRTRKMLKCDLCNGDPLCVKYCQPKAIEYVGKDHADFKEKMNEAERLLRSVRSQRKTAVLRAKPK